MGIVELRRGWCALVVAVAAMASWADAAPLPAEAKAVALVEARGGAIAYDDSGHVKGVDLAERPATDADLAVLAELPKLAALEVWGAEISDAGMAAVARMAGLKQLALENTDITDAGAAEIARLPALRVLNLRRSSNLSDAALQSLARLATLEQLVLLYNNFTDAGLAHLAPLQ